jgi:hypothetical protein
MRLREPSESAQQQALVQWARLHTGKYPELAYLYAIPNGANTTRENKKRLMREGLHPGVVDLHLPVPRGRFHGLWIEMKATKGRLTKEQQDWLDSMLLLGHEAIVVRDWFTGSKIIEDYLNDRKRTNP